MFSKILRWKLNFNLRNARMHYFFFIGEMTLVAESQSKSTDFGQLELINIIRFHTE